MFLLVGSDGPRQPPTAKPRVFHNSIVEEPHLELSEQSGDRTGSSSSGGGLSNLPPSKPERQKYQKEPPKPPPVSEEFEVW